MSLRHKTGSTSEIDTQDNNSTDAETSGTNNNFCVLCWGCGLQLMLSSYSPVYKCGYCGAISYTENLPGTHKKCSPCCSNFFVCRDRFIVAVVIIIISAIIGGGVWAIFPVLFPNNNSWFYFHSCLTFCFSFNVLFNYAMAVGRKAGEVKKMPWGRADIVNPNSLEQYTFCSKCVLPKPPGAHHCRQCKECVLEMDHHCPFIGNCVGVSNQRHFVLFLIWVVSSFLYIVCLGSASLLYLQPSLFSWKSYKHIPRMGGGYLGVQVVKAIMQYEASISIRTMVLGYLIVVAISSVAGLGFLLFQQVRLIVEGQTYIDSLQDPEYSSKNLGSTIFQGFTKTTLRANLSRVFGNGHPLLWIVPRVHPPKESYADFLQSKHHSS